MKNTVFIGLFTLFLISCGAEEIEEKSVEEIDPEYIMELEEATNNVERMLNAIELQIDSTDQKIDTLLIGI